MTTAAIRARKGSPLRRRLELIRLGVVLLGLAVGQFILYGPSLVGQKILLPLDFLAEPGIYTPRSGELAQSVSQNTTLSDLVLMCEPLRQFGVSELRAGRLPLWSPNQYAGVAYIWPKFSPFLALEFCTASPVILAWAQFLAAMVAGTGAYFFSRRVLSLSFWPGAVIAWCYPLTGFFILWQGYPTGLAVYWLPWLLAAVHQTVHRQPWAPLGLAVATALTLLSGHLDVAGQVLLGSGFFALWCLVDVYRHSSRAHSSASPPSSETPAGTRARCCLGLLQGRVLTLTLGWLCGLLLAAPHILPVLDHVQTGARMIKRSEGAQERPPVGISALPEVLLPDMYGRQIRLAGGNQLESSAAAFSGIIATLFAAPLAFSSRRRRRIACFFLVLALLGLSWCLNLPGMVQVLRLPGLNMMSHNRLTFLTSFGILCLAGIGLEVLKIRTRVHFASAQAAEAKSPAMLSGSRGPSVRLPYGAWLALGLLVSLAGFALWRSFCPPEPVKAFLEGQFPGWLTVHYLKGLREYQLSYYLAGTAWCGLGILAWVCFSGRLPWRRYLFPAVSLLLVGELLCFAYGRNPQSDPSLYYPVIPVLQQVARAAPGRVIGAGVLPAALSEMAGLRDVRGYDSVDPARYVELLTLGTNLRGGSYACTQFAEPKGSLSATGGVQLSPVLNLLGVRYVILRGTPPSGVCPRFQGADYWVMENPGALPRVFVPRRVEVVTNAAERLRRLALPQFDAREVAYVESPVDLPACSQGKVRIIEEIPTRIRVGLNMTTAALVELADTWDKGWRAYLNGKPTPILCVNHALRGVIVPAGTGELDFRYEPASFAWGLGLAAVSALGLLGWAGVLAWRARRGVGRHAPT